MGKENKKCTRLGETRVMTNGQKATIIAYRRCDNIDVRFEDGTVAEKKTYQSFKRGHIANPNYKTIKKKYKSRKETRLGETRIMNNGQKATIIVYQGTDDIDIQFEDGTVVKKKTYAHFKEGHIANPNKLKRRA